MLAGHLIIPYSSQMSGAVKICVNLNVHNLTVSLLCCSFKYGFHISRWIQGKRIEGVWLFSHFSVFFFSFLSVGSEIKHTELAWHCRKLIFARSEGLCMKNSLERTIFGLARASLLLSLHFFPRADDIMNSKSHPIWIIHTEYRSFVHIHCSWSDSKYWRRIEGKKIKVEDQL